METPPPPHHDMLGRLVKRKVKRKEAIVLLRLNELNQNGKGTKRNKKKQNTKKRRKGVVWKDEMIWRRTERMRKGV